MKESWFTAVLFRLNTQYLGEGPSPYDKFLKEVYFAWGARE